MRQQRVLRLRPEADFVTAQGARDAVLGATGSSGFATAAEITSEIGALETLEAQAQGLEGDVSAAESARDAFFGAGGAREGYADSSRHWHC